MADGSNDYSAPNDDDSASEEEMPFEEILMNMSSNSMEITNV
jgi:hypothetical protein